MLASPWVILAAVLALAGISGWSYFKGRSDGSDAVIARQARDDEIRFETLQLAQQAAAEEIAKIEVKNVTIRQRLETQIRDKPVYRDCIADQRVLDTVNEAITGDFTAGPGELPAAGSNDGAGLR